MRLLAILFAAALFNSFAAGAEPKPAKTAKKTAAWPPKDGVKTPGVLIQMALLKAEAEIKLEGAPDSFLFSDQVLVPDSARGLVARIDGAKNTVSDPLKGFTRPCGGALSAFRSIWIPDCGTGTVRRLDTKADAKNAPKGDAKADAKAEPKTEPKPEPTSAPKPTGAPKNDAPPGKVTAEIASGVGSARVALAASADSIWVLADDKTTLARIDPDENKVVSETRLPAGCTSVIFAESALWVTCPGEPKLLRIDPGTGLVSNRIEVAAGPVAVAFGEGSIWVLSKSGGKVSRVDPKTNKVTVTIDLAIPEAAGSIAFGEGSLWVSVPGFPISRISPQTDKVVQQFAGEGGGILYAGLKSIWLAEPARGMVLRFDPKRIAATLSE